MQRPFFPPRRGFSSTLRRVIALGLAWPSAALAQTPPSDPAAMAAELEALAPNVDESKVDVLEQGEPRDPAEGPQTQEALPEPPADPPAPSPDASTKTAHETKATAGVDEATVAALTAWGAQQSPACQVRAVAQEGERFFLACGRAGLWRVRRAPPDSTQKAPGTDGMDLLVLEAREHRGGEVVGFARVNGALVIVVNLRVVQPLDERDQLVSASLSFVDEGTSVVDQTTPSGPIGKVIAGGGGLKVTFDLDPGHRIGVGYRVLFRWGSERVIGRVLRVDGPRVVVTIGMHEVRPPVGTIAESTPERPTSRVMAPRDGAYHFTFDLGTRLGLSRDGIFGAEGGIQARFGKLLVTGEVRPFVLSTLGIGVLQAFASFGVTTTWLGLTFGAGTSTVNLHAANPPGTGILLTPAVRIGTVDGLRLGVRAGTTFHRQEMHFTALFVDAQIPVSRFVAVLAEGGGGDLGLGEGEVGMRTLIQGNGGPKSWFLKTSLGATLLQQNLSVVQRAVAPHVRIVVEARL